MKPTVMPMNEPFCEHSPGPVPPASPEAIDSLYLVGGSAPMRRLRSQLERIAPYLRTALITGEAGTGKWLLARALHARGASADGPFLHVESARLAEQLAVSDHGTDILEEAQGGTLYLARIDAVPMQHQPLLLHLLHQQEVRAHRGSLRIVASSSRDLRMLTTTGLFRDDLHRRLSAVEMALTPLRKRQEDLPVLAEIVLEHSGGHGLSAEAAARLAQHGWPENLRELRSIMERAVALAGDEVVDARHLMLPEQTEAAHSQPDRLQEVIQRHVLDVLTRCSGNKLRASEMLGISRSTLYRMLDACATGGDTGLPG